MDGKYARSARSALMAKSLSGCAVAIGDFSNSDESMRATCAPNCFHHTVRSAHVIWHVESPESGAYQLRRCTGIGRASPCQGLELACKRPKSGKGLPVY